MNKLSKKNWIAFWIIIFVQTFILMLRFNFMNIPMTFFKSLFRLLGISTAYLFTQSYISGFFLALIILYIITMIFLICYFLKEPLETYGFHFRKFHLQLISGVLLAIILLELRNEYVVEILLSNHFIEHFSVQTLLSFLSAFIYASYEEVLFRGFLLNFFQKLFRSPMFSVFLSAIIFGICHYPIGPRIGYCIYTFSFGLVLAYLKIKSPEKFTIFSLSLAHGLHNFVWDWIQFF